MFKYSEKNLKKIEELFRETGYDIRYERGQFKSGCCVLQDRKVVVINRYYPLEARMNSMIELILSLEIDPAVLSDSSREVKEQISSVNPGKKVVP